ncbi:nuclear transport factor 2 family protein [Roseiflexus castenholzii]|uniref:nuclear transport factor 2 family protein n=1 Tax=Roseiflexus castenholzii TaxID=120962 RepID=UPI0018DC4A92|nr:nuclear transport factor 2 family protein [Roseiflexus castenholzii]
MRIVLNFNDVFNRHDVAGMMQLMSDDCAFENTHPAPDGTNYSGKAAVAQFWRDFFRRSPHAHIDIEEMFGGGQRCVIPMTIDDAAFVSFRAQRLVIPSAATCHSERSEESKRVAPDPSR